MGIKDGGHRGYPLARSLSPEPRVPETIGQGHHNGPKLVFDILLGRESLFLTVSTPRFQPCPRSEPDLGQTLKLRSLERETAVEKDRARI